MRTVTALAQQQQKLKELQQNLTEALERAHTKTRKLENEVALCTSCTEGIAQDVENVNKDGDTMQIDPSPADRRAPSATLAKTSKLANTPTNEDIHHDSNSTPLRAEIPNETLSRKEPN